MNGYERGMTVWRFTEQFEEVDNVSLKRPCVTDIPPPSPLTPSCAPYTLQHRPHRRRTPRRLSHSLKVRVIHRLDGGESLLVVEAQKLVEEIDSLVGDVALVL
jgi:hypothetical protein